MEQSKYYPLQILCRVCKISRSGYYEWLRREESNVKSENNALKVKVREVFEQSRRTYGSIRITKKLEQMGAVVNRSLVARIMQREGIKSVHKRKFKPCTTDSKHALPIAENVLEQDFSATAPNQKWGCDISYIPTDEGFLYLAVVLDFFSRKVVGYSLDENMTAELCCEALRKALILRQPPAQLIHHSDRGSQYASFKYHTLIKQNQFNQSMSRKGNCYDNAVVESFFHTLKVECVNRQVYKSKQQAKESIIDYINCFYNSERLHSTLDYMSPVDFELQYKIAA